MWFDCWLDSDLIEILVRFNWILVFIGSILFGFKSILFGFQSISMFKLLFLPLAAC